MSSSPDVLNLMRVIDNDPDDGIVMMSPDGGDPGGRPGQDHPEVDEGEAGEEAVKVECKCHHSHCTTVLHVSLKILEKCCSFDLIEII